MVDDGTVRPGQATRRVKGGIRWVARDPSGSTAQRCFAELPAFSLGHLRWQPACRTHAWI